MPGTTGWPSTASTTVSALALSRRWAYSFVKTGGMCWVMSTGTGRLPGSLGITAVSASGPPVEEPMMSARGLPVPPAGRVRGLAGAPAGAAGAGRGRKAGRGSAKRGTRALIFGMSWERTLSMDSVTLPTLAGLVT